jgi:hypothetical protein
MIAAAAFAAGRAWAGPAELSAALGRSELLQAAPAFDFAAARAVQQRPPADTAILGAPGAYGAPIRTIPLAPLLDAVRETKATFRAGNVVVHVFGGKSENDKNWFVEFAPEGAGAQFFKGSKMIHWSIVLNGTAHFEIAGRKYSAYIQGKAKPSERMQSVLIVQPDDKSEPQSRWTIQEITDDYYAAAEPLSIGGKEYRLTYTRDFNEDGNGDFSGYTADRSIVLMTCEGGNTIGYHWFEREIPRDRILVSTPKAVGVDDETAGKLTVGLLVNPAGALEVYAPRN